MALCNMRQILTHAMENEYAVGAFNIVDLNFLEAIVKTAETARSPVVLSIAEVHFPYINLDLLCPAVKSIARTADIPIALHLDHGTQLSSVLKAMRYGFTSVMFDGSALDFQQNIAQTKRVVELCQPLEITVEAELGAVGGDEGGNLESEAKPELFTDPDQAAEFVTHTKIDALAVAIGNSHGKYTGKPHLDFKRLSQIKTRTGIPLVLHGGSGLSVSDFTTAIQYGISKINFYTGLSQQALAGVALFMNKKEKKYHDYPEMLSIIKESVSRIVAEQIEIFGSKNRAFPCK